MTYRFVRSLSKTPTLMLCVGMIATVFAVAEPINVSAQLPDTPVLANPNLFQVELHTDLEGYDRDPSAPAPGNWVWEIALSSGENGFPAGLYAAGGPSFQGDDQLRKLFRIEGPGEVIIVEDGFEVGAECFVFAQGNYGDGMLLTQPQTLKIVRLLSDGTLSTFASLGTAPFGPAGVCYGLDGYLYVTDFTGRSIHRVYPNGDSEIFASIDHVAPIGGGAKACMADTSGQYGGGLIVGTFTFAATEPHGLDAVYSISADGSTVTQLADGLTGIEFLRFGPGGDFGSDLFVSVHGTNLNGDGGVYTLAPDGSLTPFLTGIDATQVAFDPEGILAGGMFIGDMYNYVDAPEDPSSKIWWVTIVASVGGIVVSVDKFALLAPYIGLASTIVVASVATAIYVKRVKHRKKK